MTVRLLDGRGAVSRPMLNPIGTYQGSALGPLLFNIYAADMSLSLTDDVTRDRCLVQCADDTQVAVFGRPRDLATTVTHIQQELTAISLWLGKNGLKVNADKTQLIVIGTKQILRNLPPITVNFLGANVTGSPTLKNLGVMFDQNITFVRPEPHLRRSCDRRDAPMYWCLERAEPLPARPPGGDADRAGAGAGVIHSLLYQRVWRLWWDTEITELWSLHEHISDFLKELQWLSAENLWWYHSLTMLKRTLHSGQPESTRSSVHGTVRDRRTRLTPAIHTESGHRRFLYLAVPMYNSLP